MKSPISLALAISLCLSVAVTPSWAAEFRPPVTGLMGVLPGPVVIGDFNNDGIADLAVGNGGSVSDPRGAVNVRLGNGNGTFQERKRSFVPASVLALAAGDFNGDGNLDLVAASDLVQNAPGRANILLGNGDGTFQTAVGYRVGRVPFTVGVGDFNNDGKPDVVTENYGSSTMSVLINNGDGTFQRRRDYTTAIDPFSVGIADFNGDGKLDIATVNIYSSNIAVFLNKGDGTFHKAVYYSFSRVPSELATGDFNGDGIVDLAIGNYNDVSFPGSVAIIFGNGDGTFSTSFKTYEVERAPTSIAVADLDGDGILDIVTLSRPYDKISVLLGKGDGSFLPWQGYDTGRQPPDLAVGDLNNDGFPDIAVTDAPVSGLGPLALFFNNGHR